MRLRDQVDRIEHAAVLDRISQPLAAVVDRLLPRGTTRDVLHGSPLGHPLHPALTDVPIGLLTSVSVLDLLGGRRARGAADRLLGLGILSIPPTAAAGLADWVAIGESAAPRRVGLVHAGLQSVTSTLYVMSWWARRSGRRGRGVRLALAGATVSATSAYLGGHLAYRQGIGVDRTAADSPPSDWAVVAELAALKEGRPTAARAGDVALVLHRRGDQVHALAGTCSHLAGPLADGFVGEVDGQPCITCPWHGSVFSLLDGHVVHGPATAPQPVYDVRVRDGKVEVRPHPGPVRSRDVQRS